MTDYLIIIIIIIVRTLVTSVAFPPLIASIEVSPNCSSSDVIEEVADGENDKVVSFMCAPRRLARSFPHQQFNSAKKDVLIAEFEYGEIKGATPKEEVVMKENKMKEIESLKAIVEEKKSLLEEFKAQVMDDMKLMSPWTCAFMSAVEAGMTCFMTAPKVDCIGYPIGLYDKHNSNR